MMDALYVVHYAEIGLKGRNRATFEKHLIENIAKQHEIEKAWRLPGRIIVRAGSNLDLSRVFGVAWWAKADLIAVDFGQIRRRAIEAATEGTRERHSFAVRAKVADRNFGMNSQELEIEIGREICEATKLEVNLDNPGRTVFIEITQGGALIYTQKESGPGGLPVGTSAMLMGLFSGGMDSALATYLMAKRGSRVELVHFHAHPKADVAHREKIGEMGRLMTRFDPDLCIHYVPYHLYEVATSTLPSRIRRHELIVFRRFMARVAERIAGERGAKALFSGDNLGQVASQTMENLIAVDKAVGMPIFRPVIAYDKVEIVDKVKEIGMYDISIRDYKDCCSIVSRHPATRANLRMVAALETEIECDKLVEETLREVETIQAAGIQKEGDGRTQASAVA